MFVIALLDYNFIAEEACCLCARMRDQRFLLGKFKLELFAQKFPQKVLNLLCFFFGSSEAKERIIGISHIIKPSIVRVVGVHRGQLLRFFQKCLCLLEVTTFSAFPGPLYERFVAVVLLSDFATCVYREELLLNKLVQPIQVDIAEYWTDHPALWAAAQRLVIGPFFKVSSLDPVLNESQKSVVVELFTQD